MASEDVIELGSSDDEAEPAPKKRKPMPNAMVHIPNERPRDTIKPSKANQFRKHKGVSPKPIIISKSVYNVNSNVIKNKQLGGAISIKNIPKSLKTQISIPKKCGINPLNLNKNLIRPQLSVPIRTVLKPTEVKGSKLLNNLPSDITISVVHKARSSEITKQCKINALRNTVEMLTVELDDEEVSESTTSKTASPQWYLRPEEPSTQMDQGQTKREGESADSMEEQNNKEPESTKYVEIIIEDSPLKSLPDKHTSEIGKELAITIDDSPAKVIPHISNNEGSENEDDVTKIPHSKKKLEYPKQTERQVVEIEIDLMDTGPAPVEISDNKDVTQKDITNKEDKTMKNINETANDVCQNNTKQETDQTKDNEDAASNNEFHPVYQNFINMCFKLENSDDMKKIVEKKIKAYYKQCPKEYVESEDFIDMVSSKIVSMKADPEKMYLYIKDIVDELNLQRKMAKSTIITKKEDLSQDSSKEPEHEESACHGKKRKQIRKLEKTIKKLHRAIQKLEEQEVDFDDDEESVYLITERYKERMVRVHKKFCQLTKTKMPSEPRLHIESRPGRPLGPARKLEKWVNKKVPVGSLLPFPDFHDVLQCVRDSNDEDKLGWNEYDIMDEARDLFTRCGRKLQRRRQENEWRLAASRITQNADPAEVNDELNKKLNDNKALATTKEVELLNQYAEKQNQLKLEAVEIDDKEAEESPEESDEDEEEGVEISNSLEDKHKRKDKVKKILQDTIKNNVENVNDGKTMKETEGENDIVGNEEPGNQNNESDKTENAEPSDKTESAEPSDKTESAEPSDKTESAEPSDKTESAEPSDKTESAEPSDKTGNAEPHLEINTENSCTLTECGEKNEAILENVDSEQVELGSESDIDKVESDIDELHLYQKSRKSFYLEDEVNSPESSDSDTPIANSDTLESESDVETDKKQSDIISIENSSYSESESTNYGTFLNDKSMNVENLKKDKLEVEYSKEEHVEYVDLENILLASSDEEDTNKVVDVEMDDTSINLKDDNISISETMVHGKTVEQDTVNNEELFSSENNIPSTTPEEIPTKDEDNIMMECSEDDENVILKDTAIEINKDSEEINSGGSPKEIVDMGSVSDGTSIASIEMQTDVENKVVEEIETLDEPDIQENEANESSCDSRISEVVEPIS